MSSHELGFLLSKKGKEKKVLNEWRAMKSLVHKIRLHGRRGKGTAESFSREKLRQAPQKEGGKILCDPGWYVHKPDVQNKWDGNTHNTHIILESEKRKEKKAATNKGIGVAGVSKKSIHYIFKEKSERI